MKRILTAVATIASTLAPLAVVPAASAQTVQILGAGRPCVVPDEQLLTGDERAVGRWARQAPATSCVRGLFAYAEAMKRGNTAAARAALEGIRDVTPVPTSVLNAFLFAAEGKTDEALEAIADAPAAGMPGTRGDPQDSPSLPLLLEVLGQGEDALALYESRNVGVQMKEFFEKEQNFLVNLASDEVLRHAELAHRLGKTQDAAALYASILEVSPYNPVAREGARRLAAGQGPVTPATDARRALAYTFSQGASLYTLTWAIQNSGMPPGQTPPIPAESLTLSYLTILIAPELDEARAGLAGSLTAFKGHDGALRIARGVTRNQMFAPDARLVEAQAFKEKERRSDALRAVRAAAQSPRVDIQLSAASLFQDLGAVADATRIQDAAVNGASFPKARLDALQARGYSRFLLGNMVGAAADGASILELNPESRRQRLAAATLMARDPARMPAALTALRAELAKDRDDPELLNALGFTLLESGESGLAEGYRLISRAVAAAPQNAAIVDSWGWAHYLHGDFERAIEYLEKADVLSGPENPNAEILDHLGDAYWRLGDQAEARTIWQRAIAAEPEAPRKADLERKLREGLTTPAPARRPKPTTSTGPRTET
jgi:tetratricopeptide (TPR) repeat protein